jgi:hypothetical protein
LNTNVLPSRLCCWHCGVRFVLSRVWLMTSLVQRTDGRSVRNAYIRSSRPSFSSSFIVSGTSLLLVTTVAPDWHRPLNNVAWVWILQSTYTHNKV